MTDSITLDSDLHYHYFEVWEPRWHDKRVLLAKRKVGEHNKIVFTGGPNKKNSMGAHPYYLSGKTIKKYKTESNGSIDCYAIPLDELQLLEFNAHSERDWK